MSEHKQNHIEKIFKESAQIDVDLILDYLDNKLSPEKKHQVEKALLNNPFLADALEGLEQLSSENRKRMVFELLGKEQKEPIVIPYKLIGIAAATLIGISTLFFITRSLLNSSSENLAHQEATEEVSKTKPKKHESTDDVHLEERIRSTKKESDSGEAESGLEEQEAVEEDATINNMRVSEEMLSESDVAMPIESTTKKITITDSMVKPKSAFQEAPVSANQITLEEPESVVEPMKDKEESKADKIVASPQEMALSMIPTLKLKINSSSYAPAVSKPQEMDMEAMSKKEAVSLDNFIKGMVAFDKGDFSEAVSKLETAYKKDNSLQDIKFYLATSYLCGTNNLAKAKKVFVAENIQVHTEEKQWIQSILYLYEGKVDVATTQLEKIVESNSYFKGEAQSILDQLK